MFFNIDNYLSLEAILKYKNHLSVDTSRCVTKYLSNFHFFQVHKKSVIKEMKNFELKQTVQDTDILVKILKKNAGFCCRTNMLQIE